VPVNACCGRAQHDTILWMRLFAALAFFGLMAGCMPQVAVAPGKGPKENLQGAATALAKSGYTCERMKEKTVFLCEQEEPKIRFLLGYEDMPARVVIAMTEPFNTPCDVERMEKVNNFHDHVDYALAYCEDKAITFVGSYPIPEHGLTAKDLTTYVRWWTKSTLQAGANVGLFEDEGSDDDEGPAPPGGPGKKGKPPVSDPSTDGTKT